MGSPYLSKSIAISINFCAFISTENPGAGIGIVLCLPKLFA